jgi:hypothetical protein
LYLHDVFKFDRDEGLRNVEEDCREVLDGTEINFVEELENLELFRSESEGILEVVEMDFDTELVEDGVALAEVEEVDTRSAARYIFNTLLPPQYSNLLSAQTIVHPPLMMDPVLVLPALITLPQ